MSLEEFKLPSLKDKILEKGKEEEKKPKKVKKEEVVEPLKVKGKKYGKKK